MKWVRINEIWYDRYDPAFPARRPPPGAPCETRFYRPFTEPVACSSPMQIPEIPLPFGLGFLRQPRPGIRQQAGDELRVKAGAAGALDAARPARPVAKGASGAGATGLSTATTLAEGVRALRADGRLPPRGSLLDLSV